MTSPIANLPDKATLVGLYRTMQTIRQCEEELARCHQRGLVHGACHTYVGQEAIATAVCAHLDRDDVIFSTHRGHGHALAKGLDPGAALVFLLAGPATNAATLGVVAGFMGRRVVGVYLASITVFSLCAGWAVNALYDALGGFEGSTILTQHEHLSPLHRIGGALLGLLLLGHIIAILARRGAPPTDTDPAS